MLTGETAPLAEFVTRETVLIDYFCLLTGEPLLQKGSPVKGKNLLAVRDNCFL